LFARRSPERKLRGFVAMSNKFGLTLSLLSP